MGEAGFVDLHLHILPGLDDGARDLVASLAMLQGLAALGFAHLCATPHADDQRHTYDGARIAAERDALAAAAGDLPIRLDYGAEYAYGPRFHAGVAGRSLITLAGTRYVLLELPETFMPASMPQTLFEVGAAGYYPVIAHPERCRSFHDDVPRLEQLAAGRALIQVSFRSLAGTFGRTIKKTAWRLVSEGIADLVATDCHSPRELTKIVAPVLKALHKRLDPDHLDRLMRRFPERMLVDGAR